jgi:hypothetical protein
MGGRPAWQACREPDACCLLRGPLQPLAPLSNSQMLVLPSFRPPPSARKADEWPARRRRQRSSPSLHHTLPQLVRPRFSQLSRRRLGTGTFHPCTHTCSSSAPALVVCRCLPSSPLASRRIVTRPTATLLRCLADLPLPSLRCCQLPLNLLTTHYPSHHVQPGLLQLRHGCVLILPPPWSPVGVATGGCSLRQRIRWRQYSFTAWPTPLPTLSERSEAMT